MALGPVRAPKAALIMSTKAFKARYVFPVDGAPIEGGVVHIQGNRIVEVGRHVTAAAIEDLGDVAILPGLINVHCHLEFSQLQRPIGVPGLPFADWIRQVIHWRLAAANTDCRPYWQEAIRIGLRESFAAGVTCVGDIVTVDDAAECYADYLGQAVLFRELLGLAVDRAAGLKTVARNHVAESQTASRPVVVRTQSACPLFNSNGRGARRVSIITATSFSRGDAPGGESGRA